MTEWTNDYFTAEKSIQKGPICDEIGQVASGSSISYGYQLMRSCATVQTTHTQLLICCWNCSAELIVCWSNTLHKRDVDLRGNRLGDPYGRSVVLPIWCSGLRKYSLVMAESYQSTVQSCKHPYHESVSYLLMKKTNIDFGNEGVVLVRIPK